MMTAACCSRTPRKLFRRARRAPAPVEVAAERRPSTRPRQGDAAGYRSRPSRGCARGAARQLPSSTRGIRGRCRRCACRQKGGQSSAVLRRSHQGLESRLWSGRWLNHARQLLPAEARTLAVPASTFVPFDGRLAGSPSLDSQSISLASLICSENHAVCLSRARQRRCSTRLGHSESKGVWAVAATLCSWRRARMVSTLRQLEPRYRWRTTARRSDSAYSPGTAACEEAETHQRKGVVRSQGKAAPQPKPML